MSILIKGMEMPTSCDKCIYSAWSNFYQIYVCNAVRNNEPVLFDGKQTKSTAVARSARADNCPLVPVPPHGDLIDSGTYRDEFMSGVYDLCNDDPDNNRANAIIDLFDSAPVIIPANIEERARP